MWDLLCSNYSCQRWAVILRAIMHLFSLIREFRVSLNPEEFPPNSKIIKLNHSHYLKVAIHCSTLLLCDQMVISMSMYYYMSRCTDWCIEHLLFCILYLSFFSIITVWYLQTELVLCPLLLQFLTWWYSSHNTDCITSLLRLPPFLYVLDICTKNLYLGHSLIKTFQGYHQYNTCLQLS